MAVLLADQLMPITNLAVGVVVTLAAILTIAGAIFQPPWLMRTFLARCRYGRTEGFASVSRIGALAIGIFLATCGLTCVLNGYFKILPNTAVFPLIATAFVLVCLAAIFDFWHDKIRQPKERTHAPKAKGKRRKR